MRRGRHAADDGSFGRSAGGAMGRGVALIAVAVVLGVILLRATDEGEPFVSVADDTPAESTTTTTAPPGGVDTTAPPGEAPPAPATPRDPASVTVLVANASGVSGIAARHTDTLKAANYVTAEPTNTTRSDTSFVYFTPGFEPEAAVIAALFSPTPAVQAMPEPPPVADLLGAQVLVVAGRDLAG